MSKHPLLLGLTLLSASLFTGQAFADRTVTDQLGRQVTLPDHVTRVVVLQHQTLNLLVQLHAAEEIVGVSVSKFTKRFPAIKVSIEVPDEVLMVPMDATLIRQVIMNLLENAAIHGGNVTQIRVCLSREGTNACFSVSDNGVGIPKEKLTTIFNGGLSGVSHNNFDMKKNMGIGLSVCYTIVKAHGGTMTAENLDLGGACFRFYLPLEEGINSEIEG